MTLRGGTCEKSVSSLELNKGRSLLVISVLIHMSHEDVGVKTRYSEFMSVANEEREKLERGQEEVGGLDGLTQEAKIILESRGLACLRTKENISGAVRMLGLAGALERSDVVAMLKEQFDRLDKSASERDQGLLVELCENLASAKSAMGGH